jgi:hypothetical protein
MRRILASALIAACAPSWPEGVTRLDEVAPANDATEHWRAQGFVPLVPPVPLPTSADGRMRIEVWARVPEGARLEVGSRGEPVFPPGSELVRLEIFRTRPAAGPDAWVLADARGTRLLPSGLQVYSLRRPARLAPLSPWVGAEWPADSHRFLSEGVLGGFQRALGLDHGALQRLRTQNQCPHCHQPQLERGPPPIRRGTDRHGFYVPATLLADEVPLERYRDREPHGDGLVVQCSDGREPTITSSEAGTWHHECSGGAVPVGRVRVTEATGALREHLAAHCESAAWLARHGPFEVPARCSSLQ